MNREDKYMIREDKYNTYVGEWLNIYCEQGLLLRREDITPDGYN